MKDCFRILTLGVLIPCLLLAAFWLGRRSAHDGGEAIGGEWVVESLPSMVDTVWKPMARETVSVAVPARVDTVRIVEDYYRKYRYCDTVRLAVASGTARDSAVAIIRDTVWQNGIAGRGLSLTFYPKRIVRERSVGLLSTFGYENLTLMAEYRYRRLSLYAGYNMIGHAPVAGVGYQLLNW